MRKIYILFLVLLTGAGVAGCKKESKTTGSIVGEWYLTEIKYSTVNNGVEQVTSVNKLSKADVSSHFSFFDNGTGLQHPQDPFYANLTSFTYILSNTLSVKPMLFIVGHNTFTVSNLTDNSMTLTVKLNNVDGSYDLSVLSFSK